jgi:hypothetical protein
VDGKTKKYIENRLTAYPKVFLPQERIYAGGNTVYVSDFRFFNLSFLGKLKDEVPIGNVLAIGTTKFGSLLVETKDGTSVNLGTISNKEFAEFQRVLLMIQAGEIPEFVEAPAVMETIEAPAVMETIEGPAVERVVREAPPNYGTVVANEFFGNYKIRIFSDGYIQVSMGLGLIKGRIEKLNQIECDAQITKKSALGRGLAGIATLGANQMAPNQRGNLILSITTDKKVHVLMHDLPTAQYIKSMNKLVAVGKSVIKKDVPSEVTTTAKDSPQSQSLAQQIRELSELKDAGVISEKEFESAKQKLLS